MTAAAEHRGVERPALGRVTFVHSSDLHLSADPSPGLPGDDHFWALRRVLWVARWHDADVVLLAGDVFDHNRQPLGFVEQAVELMAAAGCSIIILPGNHDPLTPDAVYRQSRFHAYPHLHILGLSSDLVRLPWLDLEVSGRAHREYGDMPPLPTPRDRQSRWHVVMAHGHYVETLQPAERFHASWLFDDADLQGLGADYVALGHWNRAASVGGGLPPAHYSGSPTVAGTVNVVRLADLQEPLVQQVAVWCDEEAPRNSEHRSDSHRGRK